ncbi:MAG: peptide chain release factor 1 [Candidatus Aminicenantes bacterium]|nr:peptide chain release factor 1 [Candidatus Aminicenantes bacterium]
MLAELDRLEKKYQELLNLLADPNLATNPQKIKEAAKEKAELEPIVQKYQEYKRLRQALAESKEILDDPKADPDLKDLAEAEIKELSREEKKVEAELRQMLLPRDPYDGKNVFLEIRAGAGGDEATLFAQDLCRMYARYAESKGWEWEIMDQSLSPIGGFKEVILSIKGRNAYSFLKYESGVHRVQRVPKTEASGRIHTSTVTVAVLPEPDEVEVKIDPKDLKIEAFGASGPGGQNVNRNYTAIRITHKPTGIVVSCQDEKSQHRNKEKGLRILRARLFNLAKKKQEEELAKARRAQVGTGERSEKIRTYNFPQNRVTDHRLDLTFHNLQAILDGELDDLIEKLVLHFQMREIDQRASFI